MEGVKEGYEFFASAAPAGLAAESAFAWSSGYVANIDKEIDTLVDCLSEFTGSNKTIDTLSGDLAEFWYAHTFNIEAAAKESANRAWVPRSNEFGSVDIDTNFGAAYQLKMYANGEAAAKAQSISYGQAAHQGSPNAAQAIDLGIRSQNDPVYKEMFRLIADGQESEAIEFLKHKIAKESAIRPDQVERYQDTLEKLETRVRDGSGVESWSLSRDASKELAKEVKSDSFDPEKWGLTAEQIVEYKYVIDKALDAGMKAAALSAVIQITPVIISALEQLMKSGKIDSDALAEGGFNALEATAKGFITGSISAGITAYLATQHIDANSSVVAAATVLTIDTIIESWKLARGLTTGREMAQKLLKNTYSMVFAMAGGNLGQILIPIPVFGYLTGSMVGSLIAGVTFQAGSNALLGLCIDSGITFFGIVDQDYSLPKEVLKEMGLDTFDFDAFVPDSFEFQNFDSFEFSPDEFVPDFSNMHFIRRGVIEAASIGYLLS